MEMTELHPNTTSHVINIAAAGGICAVCMEPLEYTAIGPCGHGEICPSCSLHIRVFHNNRLCCICRTLCRVVAVVTVTTGGGGGWDAVAARLLRSAATGAYAQFEGRVGEKGSYWWYHAGMEAFFDDERQYAAARAAARLGPPPCGDAKENPPPPPAAPMRAGGGNSRVRDQREAGFPVSD
uniref:RING-type domain-containing protein n=1 Tax=Leersia perrieri TaxID=77586 RepID=A0A0D9X1U8_9ORYZ